MLRSVVLRQPELAALLAEGVLDQVRGQDLTLDSQMRMRGAAEGM
jgi:hypothetical protein